MQDQNIHHQKKMLQIEMLKSQELINHSIKNTLSDSGDTVKSSALTNFEKNSKEIFSNNYFTTKHEVHYNIPRSQEEYKDFLVVGPKKLYLKNGNEVMVFIGDNEIKKENIGTNK